MKQCTFYDKLDKCILKVNEPCGWDCSEYYPDRGWIWHYKNVLYTKWKFATMKNPWPAIHKYFGKKIKDY